MEIVFERVIEIATERGIANSNQLANLVNIDRGLAFRIWRGEKASVSGETVILLARGLQTNIDYLTGVGNDKRAERERLPARLDELLKTLEGLSAVRVEEIELQARLLSQLDASRMHEAQVQWDAILELLRKAKSRQGRIVFISPKTRRHVRAYLRKRDDDQPAFLLSYSQRGQNRVDYDGLRAIFNTRALAAGIQPTSPHAFRRAFAITSWRNGIDVTSIARMMGHGSLAVLMRYIAAETADLAALHDKHAPTGNL